VLDLGCGDGALLAFSAATKGVKRAGIELKPELVQAAVGARRSGVSGRRRGQPQRVPGQGLRLRHSEPDRARTRRPLHVLTQMLRIASHAIIAFPNFGHWRVRFAHLSSGRAPRTRLFPTPGTIRRTSIS